MLSSLFPPISIRIWIWIVSLVERRSVSIQQALMWHRAVWMRNSFVAFWAARRFMWLRLIAWWQFSICVGVRLWARNDIDIGFSLNSLSYYLIIWTLMIIWICKSLRCPLMWHINHRWLSRLCISIWMHARWSNIKSIACCLWAIPASAPLILTQLLILVVQECLLFINIIEVNLLRVNKSITSRNLIISMSKSTTWYLAHDFLWWKWWMWAWVTSTELVR